MDYLPSFDTSAPDNLGYYERFGFEVTVEATLPNGISLWGHDEAAASRDSSMIRFRLELD